ncbi:MAG TPA: cupredoxin domain-containing protein [Candidatus Saccharimonadales bacterium]|nr:cupredoxin domain-containing protein [Candidatus Saccharimonadales bacterium]
MDKVIVGILSIGGIIFIYWFFLMKKDEKAVVVKTTSIDISVEGGYSPNVIAIPKGKTTTLNFFRKDPSSCLEEVVLPDFKIRKYLPLNKTTPIKITPKESGTFEISCGMNMFHGKIIVS